MSTPRENTRLHPRDVRLPMAFVHERPFRHPPSQALAHVVNQAEVEGAIAGYFGVPATAPGISDLARAVLPGVEAASRGNPAGWRAVLPSVLANNIGLAKGLRDGSELHRQLEIMRHSNRTSADFV